MPHQCTDCGRVFDDGSKQMLSGCPDCEGTTFQFHPGEEARSTADDADPATDGPSTPGPGGVAETVSKTAATVRDIVGRTTTSTPASSSAGTDHQEPTADEGRDDPNRGAPSTADDEPTIDVDDVTTRSETTTSGERAAPETTEGTTDDDAGDETSGGDTVHDDASPDPWSPSSDRDEGTSRSVGGAENSAQASARTDVASLEELPPASAVEDEHRFDPVEDPNEGNESDSPEDAANATADGENARAESSGDRPDLAELREKLNDQFESIKVLSPGQYELNLMELYDREEYIIALQEDGRYTVQVPEQFHD